MATWLKSANFSDYNGSHFYISLSYDLLSQSIPDNTSTVRYYLTIGSGDGYSASGSYSNAYINGSWVGGFTSIGRNTSFQVGYLDATIKHGNDGKGTAYYSASASTNWSGLGSSSLSGNFTLPTIPRASTPSIPSASDAKELGNSITISISRAATSFKHTLRIKDGDTVVETVGTAQAIDTSQPWTPTVATYAPRIINGETKTFTIECLTYNDTTHIGTKTCDVILKVPASQKPSVTISIAEGNTLVPSSWGKYVKGISKLIVTLNETLSYSAPIATRSITVEGNNYSTNPTTTNVITASGNVTAAITDSRGHTSTTATASYTVEDYAAPQITSAMIVRCNSNGTDNPDGNYMKYTFVGSISPVANKNTKSFKIQYKQRTSAGQTEDTWHDYFTKTDAYTVNQQSVVGSTQLSSAYTYDIRFIAEDAFGPTTVNKVLDTAFDLINFHRSGRSMAFGKMSEATDSDKMLEVALDSDFQETTSFQKNITYKGYLLDSLLASTDVPIGTIIPFTSSSAPSGYMVCDGSAISRTTYAELFSVIGTTYGSGNGSTTFNLPNLKGRVLVGLDSNDTSFDSMGETGGEKTHTLTIDEMPSHNHSIIKPRWSTGAGANAMYGSNGQGTGSQYDYLANQGGGQAHNNLQPYIVVNYIIKVARGVATVPSSVTVTNADIAQINQNKDDITELKNTIPKIATAQMEDSKIFSANVKYTMDSIVSTTNKLTLYDGGIKIGAGINKVLVSAQAFAFTSSSSGYVWTAIKKNSTEISICIDNPSTQFCSVVHSPKLIDVVEGDVIYLYDIGSTATGTIRGTNNTYLTVQVIS